MIGRLHDDLFFQDRYILNGVDVKIRLVQSKNAFALMAGGDNPDYKISIDETVLFASKAKLNPAMQMGHAKALEKGTAKYPLRRVHCKVFSIPRGAMSHTRKRLFWRPTEESSVVLFGQRCLQRDIRQESIPCQTQQIELSSIVR